MTCVICPTCGSQCSLGGVGETKYFIPPKDENERIADLERQLAEAQQLVSILIEAVSKVRPKRNPDWYVTNIRASDVQIVRDYEARKPK